MTRLEIISDPICPWCYIGAVKLFRAMESQPDYGFAIRWRAYQLNPDMPPGGMERASYLAAKFGGAEKGAEVYAQIEEATREAGLDIDFSAITRTPNTIDAHRLLHWAEAEGVQTRIAMGLFHGYFQEGEDIGDHGVLARIAGKCGMDAEVVARLLSGDADREEVADEAQGSADMGVTGVPTFILGGKYALIGAQDVETWEKLITELAAAADEGSN